MFATFLTGIIRTRFAGVFPVDYKRVDLNRETSIYGNGGQRETRDPLWRTEQGDNATELVRHYHNGARRATMALFEQTALRTKVYNNRR